MTGPSLVSRTEVGVLSARAWTIVVYAAVVTTLGAGGYLARFYTFEGQRIGFGRAVVWQACVYGSWAALVPLLAWLGRRIRIGHRPWLASVTAYAAASVVIVPTHAVFTAWVTWLLRPAGVHPRPPMASVLGALVVERLPVDLLIYWAIVGLLYAAGYHAAMLGRERAAGVLEAELARAEFHALRAQLEPHFLFNALQAITALIPRDPAAAQQMTTRLGDLLRTTLRRSGVLEVTLREEVELLQHYLAIEAVRFGDRLQVAYDLAPDALECLVPDLVLQPLVENAVRHGIAPLERGGRIMIGARRRRDQLELTVTDDGMGLPIGWDVETHAGLGLAITRQRLLYAYAGRSTFTIVAAPLGRGGTTASIVIPLDDTPLAERALAASSPSSQRNFA